MMNKSLYYKILSLIISLTLVLAATGCGSEPSESKLSEQTQTSSDKPFLKFKDMADTEIVLPKKPERIVVLATETLELFYQLGGKAVGRASSAGRPVSEAQLEAQDVGQVGNESLEAITALKPDLVIGSYYFSTKLKETFADSNIPFALVKITNYDDFQLVGKLYGQILGKESEVNKTLQDMDDRIQAIVDRVPNQEVTYAHITIMPMGAYITIGASMTVDIADRLKLVNVAKKVVTDEKMPNFVPYSLEKLIEADPDYLFMVVHGTEEFGKQKMKEDMESNPAWSSLRAVKENKLIMLPDDVERTPALHLDESFEMLAKTAYPEAY